MKKHSFKPNLVRHQLYYLVDLLEHLSYAGQESQFRYLCHIEDVKKVLEIVNEIQELHRGPTI